MANRGNGQEEREYERDISNMRGDQRMQDIIR
jgi:hypothetical protein